MFPCGCPGFGSPTYVRLQLESSDESDGEEEVELQVVTTTPPAVDNVDNSDVDANEVTDRAAAHTDAAYQGIVSPAEGISFANMGYSLLRVCDYVQLFVLESLQTQSPMNRARRNLGGNVLVPIDHVNNNDSFNDEVITVPQWVYPCGITPNGTFPNGYRPFEVLNTTTKRHELLKVMDYGSYFRGEFDVLAHSWVLKGGGVLLRVRHRSREFPYGSPIFPYGMTGLGDMVLRHFDDHVPQYLYASHGISNALPYNGTCPSPNWIFNATNFFGGGYVGLEEPGFEPIYPCGVHPDGRFTGEWLGFPNGTIPDRAYPFGYFPNGTFPYLDYFFNPDFNHSALYLAVQNNQTGALQNFTRFASPNETRIGYHSIPTSPDEPFAPCYGIYHFSSNLIYDKDVSSYYSGDSDDQRNENIDRNLIRAGLWAAQLGAELGVILSQNCSRRHRIAYALYLGTRTANVVHATVDLVSNISSIIQNGHTDEQGELVLRNMLTLTDLLALTNEAIYFCTPTIQRIQESLSEGSAANYLTRLCSSLRGSGRVVRSALNRLSAVTGAIGVACTAGLGAVLTAQMIRNDDQNIPEQRAILGTQITIAAVASVALAWMTRANMRRARALEEEND